MIKYIIPFGCDCYVAITLDELKLRQFSLPFDFIYSDLNMIKESLETNFKEFLNKENYIKYQSKGCINKYFKKKFPHYNMLIGETYNNLKNRINKIKYIIKSEELKLFVHIFSKFSLQYVNTLSEIISNYSNNFKILVLIKKRRNYNTYKLEYESKNIKVFTIFTKTKSIPKDFYTEIFNNYKFELFTKEQVDNKINNQIINIKKYIPNKINESLKIKQKINNNNNMKTLVLYSYCELSKTKELRQTNLDFFIKKGIIDSDNIDFKIIINGHQVSINIPNKKNLEVIKRDNVSFDFGAYSSVILNIDYTKYNYFIFMNDSVRGPYLLNWFPRDHNWTELFTNKLDEQTKLVGATINFHKGNPHVNSEMFATDLTGLKILIQNKIISKEILTKKPVTTREIKQSQIILNNNYNIACMLEAYKNVDFRKFRGKDYRKNGRLNANLKGSGDPLYRRRYFGMSLTPFETIFYKTNRDIDNRTMNKYSDWILNGNKCNN